jgi:hypothetical protein
VAVSDFNFTPTPTLLLMRLPSIVLWWPRSSMFDP